MVPTHTLLGATNMQCYFCHANNPSWSRNCHTCGLPMRPPTGQDLAGGTILAILMLLSPGKYIHEFAIKHKVKTINSKLVEALYAMADRNYDKALRSLKATGISDDPMYPPDYRAWYHFL